MTNKTKEKILHSLGVLIFVSWILFLYMYYYYFQNVAPIKPNPDSGQIYEVNNHGYIFYLTIKQEIIAFIPCIIAIFGIGIGVLLDRRWKIYKQNYGQLRPSLAEWSVDGRAAITLILFGLFMMWGFGWQTVGRRLWTNVDGVIISSRDVPAKGASRYATEYTVRGNDGSETVFWVGPREGSLARSMPVGTRILKKRWHLDYFRDGNHVSFPYGFHAFFPMLGLILLVRGFFLLYTQRKLKTRGPT